MHIGKHPYHLLPLAAIPFLVIFFIWNDGTVDLHLHDTYFIIPARVLMLAPVIYLLIIWFAYLVTHTFLFSQKLIWFHVIFAIVLPYFIYAFPYLIHTNLLTGVQPRRYYDFNEWNYYPFRSAFPSILFRCSFLLLLLGQVIYPVNLVMGMFKLFNREPS